MTFAVSFCILSFTNGAVTTTTVNYTDANTGNVDVDGIVHAFTELEDRAAAGAGHDRGGAPQGARGAPPVARAVGVDGDRSRVQVVAERPAWRPQLGDGPMLWSSKKRHFLKRPCLKATYPQTDWDFDNQDKNAA